MNPVGENFMEKWYEAFKVWSSKWTNDRPVFAEEFKAGWDAAMKEQNDKVEVLIKVLEERCCIDDCGFDLENETVETLRECMRAIDKEARTALKIYRAARGQE